jgi:YfiH family protein
MSGILTYPDFFTGNIISGTTLRGTDFSLIPGEGFAGPVVLNQVHSDRIHYIDPFNIKKYLEEPFIEGDGLFTAYSGLLLAVRTADCVPLFYTDSQAGIAGIVHAGWRGIKKGIHLKMIDEIKNKLFIVAGDIFVMLGPHIRKCCYEVGKDMIKEFGNDNFENRDGRLYFGLEARITADLIKKGVPAGNISSAGKCTMCSADLRFYSYRSGDREERMLSFIGMNS